MKVVIKFTSVYEKEISKILSDEERTNMENNIAEDPLKWPVIRGTDGVRKARFAMGNIGKRSGGRACYLYVKIYETLYMLKAYSKSKQEDLSEREKREIVNVVKHIKDVVGDLR